MAINETMRQLTASEKKIREYAENHRCSRCNNGLIPCELQTSNHTGLVALFCSMLYRRTLDIGISVCPHCGYVEFGASTFYIPERIKQITRLT